MDPRGKRRGRASGADRPFVSVIVPTYRRPDILAETVRHLLGQEYPSYEIIVVDQSEEPRTRRSPVFCDSRVTYFSVRGRGPQAAKNYGIARARGAIILTVDDDIVPAPDLITRHVRNYGDPRVGAVGGGVFSPGEVGTDSPVVGAVRPNGIVTGNYTSRRRSEIATAAGGNFSFRKEIFDAVGPYDARYIGNFIREETDLCARIIKAGYSIIYEPEARIVHLKAPSGGCRVEGDLIWQFYFLHNNTLFFLTHMRRRFLPFFLLEHVRRALVYTYHHGKRPEMLRFLLSGMWLGLRTYRAGAVDEALLGKYLRAADKLH